MLILAVTSATATVGVALVEADPAGVVTTLAAHQITTDRRHAEELTPMIRDLMAQSGRGLGEVERFAVDVGPGRFTGLRVGLATVRTMALAFDTPATGVTCLEALAFSHPGATVAAVIDARRAEVFLQRFTVGSDGVPQPLTEPQVGDPVELAAQVDAADLVVGDGADRYPDVWPGQLLPGCEPSAVGVATLAAGRPGVPGHEVLPRYLRDPDVQINIKTRAPVVSHPAPERST